MNPCPKLVLQASSASVTMVVSTGSVVITLRARVTVPGHLSVDERTLLLLIVTRLVYMSVFLTV